MKKYTQGNDSSAENVAIYTYSRLEDLRNSVTTILRQCIWYALSDPSKGLHLGGIHTALYLKGENRQGGGGGGGNKSYPVNS